MAKPFRLSLCICLLFLTCACLASLDERLNECQLDRLNALEPYNRIESEGVVTETWNSNHPELRCAGVTLVRRTINLNGLHLPSYGNYPQLIMIVQGPFHVSFHCLISFSILTISFSISKCYKY